MQHDAIADVPNAINETPLHVSCKKGFVGIVKEILVRNNPRADDLLKACDNEKNTPMHQAVESGDLETVQVLLGFGAESCKPNGVEKAPIHIAAAHGYVAIASELLASDSSCKNLLDNQRQSPLHYAARANQVAMIDFLLSM